MTIAKHSPKPHIRQTIYGNWYGYIGRTKVEYFAETPEEGQEEQARRWLASQLKQIRQEKTNEII